MATHLHDRQRFVQTTIGLQSNQTSDDSIQTELEKNYRLLSWFLLHINLAADANDISDALYLKLIRIETALEIALDAMEVGLEALQEVSVLTHQRPNYQKGQPLPCPSLPRHLKKELARVQALMEPSK